MTVMAAGVHASVFRFKFQVCHFCYREGVHITADQEAFSRLLSGDSHYAASHSLGLIPHFP